MALFNAGFIQFDVKTGAVEANLATAVAKLDHLGAQGVKLAVLPEMWSCGFDNKNLAAHAQTTPEVLAAVSEAASRNQMVIAGSLPEAADGKVYNTQYLFDADGSLAGAYRKVHLFSFTGEERYFGGGREHTVCQTAIGSVGLLICYDLRFPELCRTLTLKGAEVIVVSAQWPLIRSKAWNTLLRARAIENQVFVIAANRSGVWDRLEYGCSQIITPMGDLLAFAEKGDCAQYARIDLDAIQKVRASMRCLRERVPEAYDL